MEVVILVVVGEGYVAGVYGFCLIEVGLKRGGWVFYCIKCELGRFSSFIIGFAFRVDFVLVVYGMGERNRRYFVLGRCF